MTDYKIITDVEALKQKSEPIDTNTDYPEDMDAVLSCFPPTALGLAAPQIGIFKRLIVVRLSHGTFVLVNPEIKNSDSKCPSVESCLSLPNIKRRITRSLNTEVQSDVVIKVSANGPYWMYEDIREKTMSLFSQDAFVVQHEYDHLEGILITDHPPYENKKATDKKLKRTQKIANARLVKANKNTHNTSTNSKKISCKQAAKLKQLKKDDKRERKASKKRVEIQERYRAMREGSI